MNENGHYRGIHIVVLNSYRGSIVLAEIYDTYKSSEDIDDFVTCHIPLDYIIIAACKDDCVSSMSQLAKDFFVNLGSAHIQNLKYRQAWAFIGRIGHKTPVAEKVGYNLKDKVSIT